MVDRAPEVRIGISGWTYDGWRGVFYPAALPRRRELAYASHRLNAIEINGTFYSMQRPTSFAAWNEQTPPGFRFAVKGSRFITDMKALRDVRAAVANFFAQGVLRLEEKLGPILWQVPARMRYDEERFEALLAMLPRDGRAALALAREHDHRVRGRACLETSAKRPVVHAIEIRHESFLCDEFVRQLRRHHAALVFSDAGPRWQYVEELTAGFVYIRLHGAKELYASGYGPRALERWAERIGAWSAGSEPSDVARITERAPPRRTRRDVWCFFDNDAKVRAPRDARRLAPLPDSDWEERHPWKTKGSRSS
jgi:uncharacterized protein YecE (DUF72 family)